MIFSKNRCIEYWITLLVFCITSCAAPPPVHIKEAAPEFKLEAAEEVFSTGLQSITEKYIEAIDIDHVTIEGLRGLGAIDPSITIEKENNSIVLSTGFSKIRQNLPNVSDAKNWGKIAANLAGAAWNDSFELRKADQEHLYEAVFDSVLSHLDNFSRYAGAREARLNRAKRDGFGGIGVQFKIINGAIIITNTFPNSPASQANLSAGDQITYVGQVPVTGLGHTQVRKQLRGPIGSETTLTIKRVSSATSTKISFVRSRIVPNTVNIKFVESIGIITISSFNHETAFSMAKTLEDVRQNKKINGLVLDLRGNPGGLLRQAVKVADLLLTRGPIISTEGRHPDSLHTYQAGGKDLVLKMPIVVLVDGRSASAAEIVAAALQDRGRAVVVGTTSFGKGTVQTVIKLPNDGEITLTWSRLIAPSGYTIHGLGVHPTICTSFYTDKEQTLRELLEKPSHVSQLFKKWKKTGMLSQDAKLKLRANCPSKKDNKNLDLQIARHILSKKQLYSDAINIYNNDGD